MRGTRGKWEVSYGVALVSRIDKIIGLFCKRALQKGEYSAQETCDFIDPTDRSHPIDAHIGAHKQLTIHKKKNRIDKIRDISIQNTQYRIE